jgi:hypothetical protein
MSRFLVWVVPNWASMMSRLAFTLAACCRGVAGVRAVRQGGLAEVLHNLIPLCKRYILRHFCGAAIHHQVPYAESARIVSQASVDGLWRRGSGSLPAGPGSRA